MSFPLYDVLIKEVKDEELTPEEKSKLISLIQSMNQKGHDIIFTLIRVHSLKTNTGKNIFDIPYEGEKEKKGGKDNIKFSIDHLPNIVSQIILKFALIHISTMTGDIPKRD